ncbi:cation transporter [Clostridia bacterium]|nr:cation transporter [Clostridia bacterium]
MNIVDFSAQLSLDCTGFPKDCADSSELFLMCRTHEIPAMRAVFNFDDSTILDCIDLDESVRYTSFDGYDFISLIHLEKHDADNFILREINMYVSNRYFILVMPEHKSARLAHLEKSVLNMAEDLKSRESASDVSNRLTRLYHEVFHELLSDFSDMFEELEDQMEALTEAIMQKTESGQFAEIAKMRKMAFTAKKQVRALSYLGAQILIDENNLIDKKHNKYFRNLDTRMKKLYDFAAGLYELSKELLYTYDSKLAARTNDTVNKLTAVTLFFGPLTVVTGIYGMNFQFMPELLSPYGYPATLGIMVIISTLLYIILKHRKWL